MLLPEERYRVTYLGAHEKGCLTQTRSTGLREGYLEDNTMLQVRLKG